MSQGHEPDQGEDNVEPYNLYEIFSIVPEFDGNQIFLNTFLNAVKCAQDMAVGNQKKFLTLHVKNKLRGKAAELKNSRNPSSWEEIKALLETRFGDSRDLTSLIQDLQRCQNSGESALNFISRLQTDSAKMHAAIQKQGLSAEQKNSQTSLIEIMTLNALLTGLDPKLGLIVRASNPVNMIQAINRVEFASNNLACLQSFPNQSINLSNKSFPNQNFTNQNFSRQNLQPNNNSYRQNFSPNQNRQPNFQQNNNYPQIRPPT
ncbi:hypothetical protein NQ315_014563 [Exocentrus adspersus]|uniref:Retrotransposon gag domain-containing protein n=1 Tax=Exocentrus adspersus TaxID=1586481 RepID=A0AAV8VKV1_9CUCU|nr:hypothetical protein NQ315_014563 [Exocentrus adspersus]